MAARYAVGDLVSVAPVEADDPYVVRLQPRGRVAVVLPAAAGAEPRYMIELLGTFPPGQHFGPFPQHRLTPGRWAPASW